MKCAPRLRIIHSPIMIQIRNDVQVNKVANNCPHERETHFWVLCANLLSIENLIDAAVEFIDYYDVCTIKSLDVGANRKK